MKIYNKILLHYLTFLCITFCPIEMIMAQSAFDKMTNEKMNKVLLRETKNVEGQLGNWQVEYFGRALFIITDQNANRMRIMTPIIEESNVHPEQLKVLLEANFDRALDSKFAYYRGFVWSVFTHPLGELGVEQFKDAMRQVARLADNYGTSYTSTNLVFGGGDGILIDRDPDSNAIFATFFPVLPEGSEFTFYAPDGKTKSVITFKVKNWEKKISIKDISDNIKAEFQFVEEAGAYVFQIIPGHNYEIK